MSILFVKSILALIMILSTFFALFTMLEVFGRGEKRKFPIPRLMKYHRINGVIFLSIYLFITYFCLNFILSSQSELTARANFHGLLALTVIVLLALKISFIRFYRQYHNRVPTLGLLIALISFGMVGTSGGYYLLVTRFGTVKTFDKIMEYKRRGISEVIEKEALKIAIKTDPESIGRGKNLFDDKCSFCHDPYSHKTIVGPGLKDVLKNPALPVSNRPAAPENIKGQLRNPFSKMPSFAYLTDTQVEDIISFLNTL